MNKTTKDVLVVSFALFSMFFGAGNVIFPPYLGLISGKEFFIATLGFVITGAGLPILAIIAISKSQSFENFADQVFPKFSNIFATVIMIAIGPMLAIPKTASLTYEIVEQTIFSGINIYIALGIFFAATMFFSLNETSVIDRLGSILTPVLLVSLIILITKGLVSPIGDIAVAESPKGFGAGFVEGYQTMDAIAAIMFAFTILKSISEKGYEGEKLVKMTSATGVMAGLGLALIYFGLSFLGASSSESVAQDITRTELLISICQNVLGKPGLFILSVIISFACLTTSIGLTTTAGSYFSKLSGGKVSYKQIVVLVSAISFVIARAGVEKIVVFSAPVLSVIYPAAIVLILLNIAGIKKHMVYKFAVIPSLIYGVLIVFLPANTVEAINEIYPIFSSGFGWLPVVTVGAVIGLLIPSNEK